MLVALLLLLWQDQGTAEYAPGTIALSTHSWSTIYTAFCLPHLCQDVVRMNSYYAAIARNSEDFKVNTEGLRSGESFKTFSPVEAPRSSFE